MRITTEDKTYKGFIVNENNSYLTIQTFQNRKVPLKKSLITNMESIIVSIESNTIKLKGNILKISGNEFEFITLDSSISQIKIHTLDSVNSDDTETEQFLKDLIRENQIKDSSANMNPSNGYAKIGVTLGFPMIFMLNYGISSKKTSGGISLGYFGVQLNYGLNVLSTEYVEINLLANLNIKSYTKYIYSNLGVEEKEIKLYAGPLIDFYAAGFHLQAGIGFGSDKEIPNRPFFQIGYAHRWGK
jgi:hypothetical protein